MRKRWPARSCVEAMFGAISAALFALALLVPDWIERAFDLAPDGGDGSAEWGWAAAFAVASIVLVADAAVVWRRSQLSSALRLPSL
jgi:hypothetical protein